MKKTLKVIALLAAAAAATASLASCSSGGESSTAASSPSSSAGSTAESTGNSGETVNLSWIQISGQPNDYQMVSDAMNAYSAEKIGVTCDITYLDWGVWGERVKAMLQSGEYFDIMFNDQGVYTSAIELGRFEPLDNLLSEVPDLQSFIPETVWKGAEYKGQIYAVPTYKDSSQTQYWTWDKEIVEKYDIPYQDIHTCAELDPYLYMLQEEINAGNIDTRGTNYAFYNTRDGINGQFMNYDVRVSHLGVRYDSKDCKVVRILEQPDIMEQLTYMHKWYQDGIINQDAPTVTEMAKWSVVYSAQGFPGAEAGWSTARGAECVIEPWAGPLYSNITIQGSLNSISSSSEHKVEALKYLELCNLDPEMRNMLAYGIEGTHYTKNEDGTITRDEVKMNDYSPAGYAQATFMTMYPVTPNAADMYDQVAAWNDTAEVSVLMGFTFNQEPVQTQIAACDAIAQQYNYNLYTGVSDPATAVPELYAAMEAAGLKDIEAEMQKQIDEFLASK